MAPLSIEERQSLRLEIEANLALLKSSRDELTAKRFEIEKQSQVLIQPQEILEDTIQPLDNTIIVILDTILDSGKITEGQLKALKASPDPLQNGIYYQYHPKEKDYKKAMEYYQSVSSNPIAKNMIGMLYHNGLGVDIDVALAVSYYKQAIEQDNNKYALYNLGNIYHTGGKHDQAVKLFYESLLQGFAPAVSMLGRCNPQDVINFLIEKEYRPGGDGYKAVKADFEKNLESL